MNMVNYLMVEGQAEAEAENISMDAEDTISEEPRLRLPHPIPYQGSKRNLAPRILAVVNGRKFRRFYEPFAGSAAMTIAAANAKLADTYIIGDSLRPLIDIWHQILSSPYAFANAYEKLWAGQLDSDANYYNLIRDQFNRSQDPVLLLYLLARCVKNAPRFNLQGEFNQSHDRRRLGMNPAKMRQQILGASTLLHSHTHAIHTDFEAIIAEATEEDIVYMDPPYEGTSTGTDRRYHQGLDRKRLISILSDLNRRNVPFLLSYDGQCGNKTYGLTLPASLHLTRLELNAGRSSQATLNGRAEITIEALYVSSNLV